MSKKTLLEEANKLSLDWDHVENSEKRKFLDSLIPFLQELEDEPTTPANTVDLRPDTATTDSSLTPIPQIVTKHARPIYTPSPSAIQTAKKFKTGKDSEDSDSDIDLLIETDNSQFPDVTVEALLNLSKTEDKLLTHQEPTASTSNAPPKRSEIPSLMSQIFPRTPSWTHVSSKRYSANNSLLRYLHPTLTQDHRVSTSTRSIIERFVERENFCPYGKNTSYVTPPKTTKRTQSLFSKKR